MLVRKVLSSNVKGPRKIVSMSLLALTLILVILSPLYGLQSTYITLSSRGEVWVQSLVGVNIPVLACRWAGIDIKAELEKIKSYGFNAIRIAIYWRFLMPTEGEVNESYFTTDDIGPEPHYGPAIDKWVNWCTELGLNCILNLKMTQWETPPDWAFPGVPMTDGAAQWDIMMNSFSEIIDLLPNPGFEEDFTGWSIYAGAPTIDTLNYCSGQKSCYFRSEGEACLISSQEVPVEVGEVITLTVCGKGRNIVKGPAEYEKLYVAGRFLDAFGNEVGYAADIDDFPTGTFDWIKVEKKFTVPEGAVSFKIAWAGLAWHASGEGWLDDIWVYKGGVVSSQLDEVQSIRDIWAYISNRYKDNNYVIFDLFNEPRRGTLPQTTLAATYKLFVEELVDIIRSYESVHHRIVAEHYVGVYVPDGIDRDVIRSIHFYDPWEEPYHRTTQYDSIRAEFGNKYAAVSTTGKPIMIGEFGRVLYPTPMEGSVDWYEDALKIFNEFGVKDWCVHNYAYSTKEEYSVINPDGTPREPYFLIILNI